MLRLIALILTVQAGFWLLVMVLRPPLAEQVLDSGRIDTVMLQDESGKLVEAGGRPDYYLGSGQQARFVADISVNDPETGIVVFAPRYNRLATLKVNGIPIPAADAEAWRGGRMGGKWLVPGALLQSGVNRIELEVQRECCRAYLDSLVVGPPGTLDTEIRNWRLRALVPAFAQLVIGLLGALGCLMIAQERTHRAAAAAAGITFSGMALSGLWQVDLLTPSSEAIYNAAGQLALLTTFAGLTALADRWFPGGPRHDRALMVAVPVLGLPIILGAFTTDGIPVAARSAIEGMTVVLGNVAIMASVVRGLRVDMRKWASDAAILSLVPTISFLDLFDSLERDPLTLGSAPLGVLALTILLLFAIMRRGRVLSQRLENANSILEQHIAGKQAELEATAALLRQREAEAAVQGERARIMRDMHDGMGGQLMSVLFMLRDQDTPKEAVTQTVEQAVDDLRLLIDSLDSVGDSLDFALGQFRERAETKLRAAGMRLIWSNRLGDPSISLPPTSILAIYRIMQEAINNAVRHSGGQSVQIAFSPHQDGGAEIRITDDGCGNASTWRTGRGLANMASRANSIGSTLVVEKGAEGTSVTFTIPGR